MPGRFETAARRWTWGVAALACVIVAEPTEGEDGDYRVYRATDTIRFERHCADAEAYQVQAWAELGSEGERRPFRADASGVLEWLDFTEPSDEDDRGGYPHNWSPEMETTATQLGLSDAEREVALDLVFTQLNSGKVIRLPGSTVWIPDRIWHGRPPKPKTLGLLAMVNPFEKGSVWQWLGRGAKYRDCIKERRAAKRAFAAQS